jgi:hypothetical protein
MLMLMISVMQGTNVEKIVIDSTFKTPLLVAKRRRVALKTSSTHLGLFGSRYRASVIRIKASVIAMPG